MTTRRSLAAAALSTAPLAVPVIYGIRLDGALRIALSTDDVAQLTGMTIREVWGAIERGELRNTGHGHRKRILAHDLLSYLGAIPEQATRDTG